MSDPIGGTHRYVARVTLQFVTPFLVGTGHGDIGSDSVFVTDANGLPAIPGSSIAGVLRHAWRRRGLPSVTWQHGKRAITIAADEDLFGTKIAKAQDRGLGSRLAVSWAAVHDAEDRPVDRLLDVNRDPMHDGVLTNARTGIVRDRVRITHTGAAADRGKFEETLVSAGHRFTFEMVLAGTDADRELWGSLLSLLQLPGLRFGKGTRHGFGAFKIVRVAARGFDLRQPIDYDAFATLGADLGRSPALPPAQPAPIATPGPQLDIILEGFGPLEPWLFGGGVPDGQEDIAAVCEPVVTWADDRGTVATRGHVLLPASSIKGVLAHRLAWHHNLLSARATPDDACVWARTDAGTDGAGADPQALTGSANPAVLCLFGAVKHTARADRPSGPDADTAEATGRAGRVTLDDRYFPAQVLTGSRPVQHVSLDRFTGGARRGLLFSERPQMPNPDFPDYRLTLAAPGPTEPPIPDRVVEALARVLTDLRCGRLLFGSGTGRGNGRFGCRAITLAGDADLKARIETHLGEDARS